MRVRVRVRAHLALDEGGRWRGGGAEEGHQGLEAADVDEALAVGAVGGEREVDHLERAAARILVLLEGEHLLRVRVRVRVGLAYLCAPCGRAP